MDDFNLLIALLYAKAAKDAQAALNVAMKELREFRNLAYELKERLDEATAEIERLRSNQS